MSTHPFVRAYMAGAVVPTLAMAGGIVVFSVARYGFNVPIPIERVIVFPLALVPNLFGLWNVLWVATRPHRKLSLGLHGAILPVLLIPMGMSGAVLLNFLSLGSNGATWFEAVRIPYLVLGPWLLCVPVIYYLVWKYVVGFCNEVVELA